MASFMIDDDVTLKGVIERYPVITEVNDAGKEIKLVRNRHYLTINEHMLTEEKEKELK